MARSRGHPKADLSDRLPVFEQAILNGKGIMEALAIAEIPDRTYYNYCGTHPDYRQKIAAMKRRVLDAAENVIIEELTRKPENDEQRAARLTLAERHYKPEQDSGSSTSLVPAQVQGGQHIMLNFGNQITAEEMQEFNDDELELVRSGAKTFDQIRAEKKLGKQIKPPQHS